MEGRRIMMATNDLLLWATIEAMAAKSLETFGQRLSRLRKQRGITQVEMAELIDITQPNISGYERDLVRPPIDTVIEIAKVLKVSTDDLLLGSKSNKAEPMVSRNLLKRVVMIQSLPKRDQQALLRTIDAFLAKSA